jgi:predicted RNase H-like HicB family nuclease
MSSAGSVARSHNLVYSGTKLKSRLMEDSMKLTIETEQEVDGRWIGEVPEIPGAMVYGATKSEAAARAEALALRILADQLEHNECQPFELTIKLEPAE